MKTRKPPSAFTSVELLLILAILVILSALFLPALTRRPPRAQGIKCINNLKNIGLAFRIFATDNNDQYPGGILLSNGMAPAQIGILQIYRTLSNELSTPKLLICPADEKRKPADSFTNLQTKNLSYFVSLSADEAEPQNLLSGDRNLQTNNVSIPPGLFALTLGTPISFSSELHNGEGNIAMADGSVQLLSAVRVSLSATNSAIATNLIVIP